MSVKRFCTNCGNELGENVKFCGKCGAPVAKEVVEPQVESVEAERQTEKAEDERQIERAETEHRYAEAKTDSNAGNPVADHKTTQSQNGKNKKWMPILIVILIAVIVALLVGMKAMSSKGSSAANSQDNVAADVSSDEESEETNTEESAEKSEGETEENDGTVKGYDSPEEYVTFVYNTYFMGCIDAEAFWEDCVSDLSKELGTTNKDNYVDDFVNLENQEGLTYISYEATGSEEVGDGIYKVNGTLKYSTTSGGQQTDQDSIYVKVENNAYKVLIDDVIGITNYTASDEGGDLTADNVIIYQCVGDTIYLMCDITNNLSTAISFGWASGYQVELVLADGTRRYYTYSSPGKLGAGETGNLSASFENVDSDISQLIIHSVYVLQSNGLPQGDESDYTIQFLVEE